MYQNEKRKMYRFDTFFVLPSNLLYLK